jgi:hypothetical protein
VRVPPVATAQFQNRSIPARIEDVPPALKPGILATLPV